MAVLSCKSRPERTPAAAREEDESPGPLRVQEGGEGEKGISPVLCFHVGLGQKAAEVGVTFRGFGQEGEVEADVGGHEVPASLASVARRWSRMCRPQITLQSRHRTRIDAHLGPGDGLDALLLGGPGELHGAVEAVVVRQGQGRIPQLLRPQHQLFRVGGAVQEGEARVGVELDVRRKGHRLQPLPWLQWTRRPPGPPP